MTAPAAADGRRGTPPPRLMLTLGGLGVLAGLLIVSVYLATQPRIRANKAAELAAAIGEVLAAPDRYDTLYVTADGVTPTPPAGVSVDQAEAVFLGYRDGQPVGFAIVADGPGFQDRIRLIFGYDPRTRRLLGMKVLESKETPGLGDKIIKDAEFVSQFTRVEAPIDGVKEGREEGRPTEVVMITGATISSRAVIRAINATLERVGPLLPVPSEVAAR